MACELTTLKEVPLFGMLDNDELTVLAEQVELRTYAARQRIYKIGDPAGPAYVLVSGSVQVTTIDEDHQDVVFDRPASGDFIGFASMLDLMADQQHAIALDGSDCNQADRHSMI